MYLLAEKLAPDAIWPEKVWKLLNVGFVPVATARVDCLAYAETGVNVAAIPIPAAIPNVRKKSRRERDLSFPWLSFLIDGYIVSCGAFEEPDSFP